MLGPSEPIVSGRAAGHNSDKVFGSLFYVWQVGMGVGVALF